jgi:MFS family permease
MSTPSQVTASSKRIDFKFILHASSAAFITYLSMYAFRKPFTSATYDGLRLWGVDYKILLIITQLIGYTISKYIGIKLVSELTARNRVKILILLLSIAWFSLFLFAITPFPYNLPFMFLNGLPLGMIWGVVFGFLEGRKSTELLGAVMASSFIVSSGLVKSVGRFVLDNWAVSEFWMPFVTGLVFLPILVIGVRMLSKIGPPDDHDKLLRTERVPMNSYERKMFVLRFAPGILFSILVYVGLTIFRDMRDNFAVEFWSALGYSKTPELLVFSEVPIAISVLVIIALMILIRNNRLAFYSNHIITIFSGFLLLFTTWLFSIQRLDPVLWMIIAGFSMYLPYIAFHTLYFERWIAHFKYKSNIGFLMSMADAAGYLGSTIILLVKNFATPTVSWVDFFMVSAIVIGLAMAVFAIAAFFFFKRLENKQIVI